MINDLEIPTFDMWKFVDDSTLSETIRKGDTSYIQNEVDKFTNQALANKFQLNEGKCKELRIGFNRNTTKFDPTIATLSKLLNVQRSLVSMFPITWSGITNRD